MNFNDGLNIEKEFYNKYLKPLFIKAGWKIMFTSSLELQKKDIDVKVKKNTIESTLSLKTVIEIYPYLFFEVISNTKKNTRGWYYYCEADWIIYTMGFRTINMISYIFKPQDIKLLNIEKYNFGKDGETRNDRGKLLYKTRGRLVPSKDFKHILKHWR